MAFDRILVVDDELIIRKSVASHFQKKRFNVAVAASLEEARAILAKDHFEFILLDERLPDGNGSELLEELVQRNDPAQFIVMMSAHATVDSAIHCMRMGAFDYLLKPFSINQIEVALTRAENYDQLVRVNQYFAKELTKGSELIGECPAIRQLKKLIRKVAATEATVLVTGENGTGKEMVAQELYRLSNLNNRPFIKVNCAAMSESLIESEFFGHEKGAFTGATQRRPGRFELADGGTILLDEIGEISPRIQAKLLRVLQEKEFERVGGTKTIPVRVRVVATTNRDLLQAVKNGEFREDLYYRLSVFPIEVPPLRERGDDILLLARRFLKTFAQKHSTRVTGFSPAAEARLAHHPWPGNVRELQNTVERAVILAEDGHLIGPEMLHLPGSKHLPIPQPESPAPVAVAVAADEEPAEAPSSAPHSAPATFLPPVGVVSLEELERQHIFRALEETNGNRARAAELLQISSRTLRNKLNLYRSQGISIPA